MSTLGIIAGGGDLPRSIAESVVEAGRKVCIVALLGSADPWVSEYPHEWVGLGQVAKANGFLHSHGCEDVLLAGKLERPNFSEIKIEAKFIFRIHRAVAAALKGDDALLRFVVSLFEEDGFRVIGAADAAPGLIVREGVLGRRQPSAQDSEDIACAFSVIAKLGEVDVGQAAIVCEGLTLAVEAAEGTDRMIARIKDLRENIRGTPKKRRGVLAKAPKSTQDGKTDLPVIGVQTVINVSAAGLTGIAVQAGGALIVDRKAVIAAVDDAGMFLVGVAPKS